MKTIIFLILFFVVTWNIASYFAPEKIPVEINVQQQPQVQAKKPRNYDGYFTPYNICVIAGSILFVSYILISGQLDDEPIRHHYDHEEEPFPNYTVKFNPENKSTI